MVKLHNVIKRRQPHTSRSTMFSLYTTRIECTCVCRKSLKERSTVVYVLYNHHITIDDRRTSKLYIFRLLALSFSLRIECQRAIDVHRRMYVCVCTLYKATMANAYGSFVIINFPSYLQIIACNIRREMCKHK